MTRKQSNKDAIERSVLAFLKRYVVRKDNERIVDVELYVAYLRLTHSDVSEEDFFRIVDNQGYKKGQPPFDQAYVNISWIDKSTMAARFKRRKAKS